MSKFKFSDQKLNELNVDNHQSLIDAFAHSCAKFSTDIAFSCLGKDLTYSELDKKSHDFAAYLTEVAGLQHGDRVAIQLPNCNQYPIIAWGILRAGLIVVNTNPLYTEREIVHQFNDSGAKVAVVLDQLLPLIEKLAPKTKLERVITVGITSNELSIESALANVETFPAVLEQGSAFELKQIVHSMDDIAVLQYTGGTTGPSKGAVLTQGNLFASARQGNGALSIDPDAKEISIAPMPLYHIYGFNLNVTGCCLAGFQSILIPNPRDIDALIQTMKAYPFTSFSGVNTLFAGMLQHPEFDNVDFSHLIGTISGGAALVSSISSEWEKRTGTQIFEGYGLSETTATLTLNTLENRKLGTVGTPLPCMEVKLINTEGTEAGIDEEGEICVRGPQVMQGYWQREEATAEVLDAEGWFKTGDIGIKQADGFIKIVDRLKDMILVSGFNVYPNEIEDVVSSHPDVFECAVVGVPDERTGEAVKLFVVKTNKDLTEQQLQDFCREQLTTYKVPKLICFADDLPKSNVGKILRRELRDKT